MATESNPRPSSTSTSSTTAMLDLTDKLDKMAPRFEIDAKDIQILETPSQFYETLKNKIRTAQTRIFLTTLYIGKEETELISTIREALLANPNLKITILADLLRGSRGSPKNSCIGPLASLIKEFGKERVIVRMYQTPNLGIIRKIMVPERIVEGWGLQHIKIYGFDDEVIVSGANLSNEYFTNRQDRYHLYSSKEMADYFADFQSVLGTLSYIIHPYTFHVERIKDAVAKEEAEEREAEIEWNDERVDPEEEEERLQQLREEREARDTVLFDESAYDHAVDWPIAQKCPSPSMDPDDYIKVANKRLTPLILPKNPPTGPVQKDTVVYPLTQLTPLLRPDTSTERPALLTLFGALAQPSMAEARWLFTAGYFNPHPSITRALVTTAASQGTVVTASPEANGFLNSAGVSGMLPAAYTLLARRFLRKARHAECGEQLTLKEWRRGTVGQPDRWTYHAKGLWVTLPGDNDPSITLVGSSNYTKRSYKLDLEMNTLVITTNPELKQRLAKEQAWLQEYATPVSEQDLKSPERKVGLRVRLAMILVSLLGGAL
ncbi:MAG: hypothetical protein M1825_001047 [Sarcosagium campestre]|nr:MAG: hypothetical protein M1825_001047 [Sarcosagium campestre]